MAYTNTGVPKYSGRSVTLLTSTDHSAMQFTVMQITTTAMQAVQATAATAAPIGVQMSVPASTSAGEPIEVATEHGQIVPIVAGAAVSVGDVLVTTTAGKVITKTGASYSVGVALTAASAANDLVAVLWLPIYYAA